MNLISNRYELLENDFEAVEAMTQQRIAAVIEKARMDGIEDDTIIELLQDAMNVLSDGLRYSGIVKSTIRYNVLG